MTIKVAINGYGRIGRNVLRACYENGRADEIEIVAIISRADIASCHCDCARIGIIALLEQFAL